jgi:ribosomal protein S18 acetylase RimI-like enzyme
MDVTWRRTTADDIDWVCALERAHVPHVTAWSPAEHLDTLTDPDCLHLVIERDGERAGFVILADLTSPSRVRQLLRIVVADKGRGLGRATLRECARLAFEEHDAERLWLDVKVDNPRARALYESEGYVLEGPSEADPSFLILSRGPDARAPGPGRR